MHSNKTLGGPKRTGTGTFEFRGPVPVPLGPLEIPRHCRAERRCWQQRFDEAARFSCFCLTSRLRHRKTAWDMNTTGESYLERPTWVRWQILALLMAFSFMSWLNRMSIAVAY